MSLLNRCRNLLLCLLVLIACYYTPSCQQPTSQTAPNTLNEARVENSTPDLNTICQNLFKEMKNMTAQRTTFALEQINQDTRMCLPLMKSSQQKQLMQLSQQMYNQFLSVDRTLEQQQAFDDYLHNQSQIPNVQQSYFEQLNIRDQYLLRHRGQAYIELIENAEGNMVYRRSPQYLANVFAIYFPEAEKVFMQELASQNQSSLSSQHNIATPAQEISRRAVFWENYLKAYPNSPFMQDAQFLLQFYTNLLFIGSPEYPVSKQYDGALDIDVAHMIEIEQLSKHKNSRLGEQARLFNQFIEMNSEQRLRQIRLSKKLYQNVSKNQSNLVEYQLSKFLNLQTHSSQNLKEIDCFKDAICH